MERRGFWGGRLGGGDGATMRWGRRVRAVAGAELGDWGWRYTGVDTAGLRALLETGRARQEEGGWGIGRLWRAR